MHRLLFAALVAVTLLYVSTASALPGCPGPCDPSRQICPEGTRYMVEFAPRGAAASERNLAFARLEASGHGAGIDVVHLRPMSRGRDVIELRGAPAASAAFAAGLVRAGLVRRIERDHDVHTFGVDSLRSSQWNLDDPAAGMSVQGAWSYSQGAGTRIAVLDSGITAHPDLDANVDLAQGYDFVQGFNGGDSSPGRDTDARDPGDGSMNPDCPSDSTWHGTRVAGVAAAVTDNSFGIAGVAPLARILPVRVLGRYGSGAESDVIAAIEWAAGAADTGAPPIVGGAADVINLSLGFTGACGAGMQEAIDYANSAGVVVIAAAGNSNVDAARISPASCNGVITVAATDRFAKRALFQYGASNWGATVEIAAPGLQVMSATNTGTGTPLAAAFKEFSGTSAAAPHVAGVVALMQALDPRTPQEVATILQQTAKSATCPAPTTCGAGIANAQAALAHVAATMPFVAKIGVSAIPSVCPTQNVFYNFTNDTFTQGASTAGYQALWTFLDGTTSTDLIIASRNVRRGTTETVTLRLTKPTGQVSTVSATVRPPLCPK